MNKIHTFFRVLSKTYTSPSYYADIIKAPFSFSLKYFFMYFFLYAIIGTCVMGLRYISPLPSILSALPTKIQKIYPEELIITVKNGSVSTNVKEPYYIPINRLYSIFSEKEALDTKSPETQYLVVIDTKGDVENFNDYHTVALVTQKSVMLADNNRGNRLISLNPNMNARIDKSVIDKLIMQFTPFLNYVVPIVIIALFIGMLVFGLFYYLFYLLFFAFLLWLLAKIMKTPLPYGKSYQFGLHMCTITATLFGVLSVFNIRLNFPLLQTIILLMWGTIVLNTMKQHRKISKAK